MGRRVWARLYVRRRNPRVQISEQINAAGHERGIAVGHAECSGDCWTRRGFARLPVLRWRLRRSVRRSFGLSAGESLRRRWTIVHVTQLWSIIWPGNLNMSFVYVEGESLLTGPS